MVKFLDALIDTYLPGIEEEGGEESLRTPTSPYPPTVQSQLSITANLNLSNSMTSLATSQHSPGQRSLHHDTHTRRHELVRSRSRNFTVHILHELLTPAHVNAIYVSNDNANSCDAIATYPSNKNNNTVTALLHLRSALCLLSHLETGSQFLWLVRDLG